MDIEQIDNQNNIVFFHEDVVRLSAKVFKTLSGRISRDFDLDAIIDSTRLFSIVVRRIMWHFKSTLEDDIVALRFSCDKDERIQSFLITSSGVLIGLYLPHLSEIVEMMINKDQLKKSVTISWENLSINDIDDEEDDFEDDESEQFENE